MPKSDFPTSCVAAFPGGVQLPVKPFVSVPEWELSTFGNLSLNFFVYKDNYILCLFSLPTIFTAIAQ